MDLKKRLEQEFLPYVAKPAQYLGNEYQVVRKNLSEVQLRIALCYPMAYEQAMADSSFEILYHVLNAHRPMWAERCFLPAPDAMNRLREKNIPLFSLESKTGLDEFDAIVFYIRSELQYLNLLNTLRSGNIPLRAVDRQEKFPLVVGAGIFNWNPEPMADFLDAAVIGNWQSGAIHALQTILNARNTNQPKAEILKRLSQLNGVYVPSLYQPIYNSFGNYDGMEKIDDSAPITVEAVGTTHSNSDPYTVDPLFPIIRVDDSGLEDIPNRAEIFINYRQRGDNLRDCDPTDHPFLPLVDFMRLNANSSEAQLILLDNTAGVFLWNKMKERLFLSNRQLHFSFPNFKIDDEKLPLQPADYFNKKEICIIAGAGGVRLRTVMNQYYRDEDLHGLIAKIVQSGRNAIRLIFLIGLPTEKPEDIQRLIELILECARICGNSGSCRLTVRIIPFIPRPYSIFQWEGFEGKQKLEAKYDLIRQNLQGSGVELHLENIAKCMLWSTLSRGSRLLSAIMEDVCLSGASDRYDQDDISIWEEAFQSKEMKWEKLLEPISVTLPLPWDHIDYGISKSYLKSQRLNALQGKIDSAISDYVHLGTGLPRAQFEKLVEPNGSGAAKIQTGDQINGISDDTPTVQYGRKVRRQIKPAAPFKKKIRVQYAKTGLSKFISHLDVGRIFELAARKAAVSLVYSQGKTPRPKMSFGPPLPIGMTSTAEFLDLEVNISDESDIQSALNRYFPEGIRIIQYKWVFNKVAALSAAINLADYEIEFGQNSLSEEPIGEWLDRAEVWVERQRKDGIQRENIRPYVTEMKTENNRLKLRARIIEGRTIRMNELFNTLSIPDNVSPATFMIQRTAQYIEENGELLTPFEAVTG